MILPLPGPIRARRMDAKRPDDSGLFVCLTRRLLVVFAQLELAGHLLLHVGRHGRIAGELDGVAALTAGERLQA